MARGRTIGDDMRHEFANFSQVSGQLGVDTARIALGTSGSFRHRGLNRSWEGRGESNNTLASGLALRTEQPDSQSQVTNIFTGRRGGAAPRAAPRTPPGSPTIELGREEHNGVVEVVDELLRCYK